MLHPSDVELIGYLPYHIRRIGSRLLKLGRINKRRFCSVRLEFGKDEADVLHLSVDLVRYLLVSYW